MLRVNYLLRQELLKNSGKCRIEEISPKVLERPTQIDSYRAPTMAKVTGELSLREVRPVSRIRVNVPPAKSARKLF